MKRFSFFEFEEEENEVHIRAWRFVRAIVVSSQRTMGNHVFPATEEDESMIAHDHMMMVRERGFQQEAHVTCRRETSQ